MEKKKSAFGQRACLLVSLLTSFITTFLGSALNLSVPAIGREFAVSASFVSWIATVYMLTCALLAIPFGLLADRVSRSLILRTGIGVFAVSALGAAFAGGMWLLLALRAVQGVGAAMIFATNIAILTSVFAAEKRGRVLGYTVCANYLGLAAGPVLGGLFAHYLGWRAIFIAAAVVSGAAFFAALKKLPPAEKDVTGGNKEKQARPLGQLCHNASFTCAALAALINYGAVYAAGYLLSLYLQIVCGLPAQKAGLVLIASPLVLALFSPWCGKLSDRLMPQKLSALGMAVCAVVTAAFSFLGQESRLLLVIVLLAGCGLGAALFSTPNTNAALAAVDKSIHGLATSVLAAMRSLGHSLCMAVVTAVAALKLGALQLDEAEPQQLVQTLRLCFYIYAALCFLGIFVALRRKT